MQYFTCCGKVKIYRKTIITILTPLVLSPLLFLATPEYSKEAACGFSILLMAVYWITEVVPLAVTALLPLVLYPILGVLPARTVCLQYFKDVNVLFFGGLTVAVAVEHWNLHKRVALKVLTLVGAKPKWLLFGFMITTAFLSMWISNVATTAMMVPIAQAVLDEMKEEDDTSSISSGTSTPDRIKLDTVIEITEPDGNTKQFHSLQTSHDDKMELVNGNNGLIPNGEPHHNHLQVAYADNDVGNEVSTEFLVKPKSSMNQVDENIERKKESEKSYNGMCKALTICICYSANIGGTATLTGTGPNLIMAGQFRTKYPDAPEIDFGRWMLFAFVGMFLYLMICWIWLQYIFLDSGIQDMLCCKKSVVTAKQIQGERIIKKQYKALGSMSYAEKTVLVMFCMMAFLWLTRDPGFVNGWGSIPFFKSRYITDATVAMSISFLLFLLPSERPNFLIRNPKRHGNSNDADILASSVGPVPPILTWKVLNEKMAWNVILLLGGGFAMALGAKESGLSALIGHKLEPLKAVPPIYAAFICCFVISLLTQCTSNTATATVFIPILAELGEILQVNPVYLMLPATLTTSYAFMFPVSTPPNAISYSYGHLKMMDMVKAGSLLNIIGLFVAVFSIYFMGGISFDVFNNCPYWLETPYCLSLNNGTILNGTTTVINNVVNATLT